jgi:hypothetical protein
LGLRLFVEHYRPPDGVFIRRSRTGHPAAYSTRMPASVVVRLVFYLWLGGALAFGHFLGFQHLPPVAVPAMVFGLTALLLLAYFRIGPVRRWADDVNLRVIVLLHVTRFVGIYFLLLYQRGELPRAFAVPGGIGDIVVATLAIPVALAPLTDFTRRRAIRIWNVVGFVDILLVVFTAARLNLADPGQLRPFTHLPLSLLPTFLVPLIIATHVVIFVRTATPAERGEA